MSTAATLSILLDKYNIKRMISCYKRVPFFICLLLAQAVAAQDAATLIAAENAFAQTAKETSVRNAFLSYLDSNGVVFNKGKIINGLQQFASQQEGSNKLLWQPHYAAVSTSGDIGFTTGPYEVRRSLDSTSIAAGQYSSVWKKNSTGEWKLLVDLGIDNKTSLFDSTASTTTIPNHQLFLL